METEECKVLLCVLLTQFGKTFTAINRIISEIGDDAECGRSVHIIFTMNTLLNNKQFATRLKVIEDTHGPGSVCVFTSKYEGPYMHVKNLMHLKGICIDMATCPRVIIMCSNRTRYRDGYQFLEVIDKNNTNIVRAFAYYDELHNYITKSLRTQIEAINDLTIVRGIIALSATPDQIWSSSGFWSKIRLLRFEEYNDDNYAGFQDMIFHNVDDFFEEPYICPKAFDFDKLDSQMIGFVKHVLDTSPEILADNTRIFLPAHKRRCGHVAVRDLILEKNENTVVVVINGTEKSIYFDGKNRMIEMSNEEVSDALGATIVKYGLQNRPIVITGFLCVGMGQTLVNQKLGSFTSAIFGHLDLSNDDIYQLFGRITGRMKHWTSYAKTHVYCPTTIMNRCRVMETCAKSMVLEHNGELVTRDDYRKPMTSLGDIGLCAIDNFRKEKHPQKRTDGEVKLCWQQFDTLDEANAFVGKAFHIKFRVRPTDVAPKTLLHADGSNPTVEELVKRQWGLNDKTPVRTCLTNENKWCVYWKKK